MESLSRGLTGKSVSGTPKGSVRAVLCMFGKRVPGPRLRLSLGAALALPPSQKEQHLLPDPSSFLQGSSQPCFVSERQDAAH